MTVLAEQWRPRFRSTQLNLLVLIVPTVLVIALGFTSFVNRMNARQLEAELHQKIERVSMEHAIILADQVRRREFENIHLLLASVIADPDIAAIRFETKDRRVRFAVGDQVAVTKNKLKINRSVTAFEDGGVRKLATLTVVASRQPMQAKLAAQNLQLKVLALLLFIAVICGTWLSYRIVAGGPLELLVHSIRKPERTTNYALETFEPIEFDGRDEIARLISAYNQSESERIGYLNQVLGANQQLEQTVAKRTEELRNALVAVERASKEKSYFFANMSHELRTPLNAIIGFADVIHAAKSKDNADDEVWLHAQVISENGRHLLGLVNTILDYAKARSGRMELNEENVDLCEVMEMTERTFRQIAVDKNITLQINYTCEPIVVRADMQKLIQIAMNIGSNALKFAPPSSTLYLSVGRSDSDAGWLEVRDTGPGMTAEELYLAVEPFRQIAGPNSRSGIGTGLGLPLSIELAKMHGGELKLESTPGIGTTATLIMPRDRRVHEEIKAGDYIAA